VKLKSDKGRGSWNKRRDHIRLLSL